MDQTAGEAVGPALDAGEKLLWAGVPQQGIVFRGSDLLMVPFSLLWAGFAVFWEYMALFPMHHVREAGPFDIVFPLFGLPFVGIGLYMVVGRFFVEAKLRSKTFYGLTDQRVIILSGLFKRTEKSLNIKTLNELSFAERADGSGTITFGTPNPMAFMVVSNPLMNRSAATTPQFDRINDAKSVYGLIRAQQKSSR